MTVEFYVNKSEPNKIFKDVAEKVITITDAQFRESVNLLTPEITIEQTLPNAKAVNYCYIDELKRWYFIDSIECIRTGIFAIKCRVDVLYTYRNSILTVSGLVDRSEEDDFHDKYLDDSERRFEVLKYHIPMNFEGSMGTLSPKLILMTCCKLIPSTP